jgi:cobalt-zinc-cadmium efflux system outer membrane protein
MGLRSALALLFAVFFFETVGAEPISEPPVSDLSQLSLREAEQLFIARNRDLKIARDAVEAAIADSLSAAAYPNPNLSLDVNSIGAKEVRGIRRADTVLRLEQLFERGGKRGLRVDAAGFAREAAERDLADVVRAQHLELHSAYYNLQHAQQKQAISRDTVALLGKTLEAAQLRLKAGDIASSELARIHVDALRVQNDDTAAQAERRKAQLALAFILGIDAYANSIIAVDPWPEPQSLPQAPSLEELVGRRPDLRAAQARVAAAEKRRDLARALRTRDVIVGAQYERFPPEPNTNNSVGIGVTIPLFTNYLFEGEIRRAEAELQAARDNLDKVHAQVLTEVGKSRSELDSALERVRRFQDVLLKQAQKAADAGEFAYRQGAVSVVELLDARRTFYATRLEAAAAQAEYAQALSAWRAALATGFPQ